MRWLTFGACFLLTVAFLSLTLIVQDSQIDGLREDVSLLEDEAAYRDEVINQLINEMKENR